MIDFSDKTYSNIMAAMLGRISDDYDKRDTSPIPTALSPAAYALEGMYLALDQVQQAGFIQTAVGSSLDLLSAIAGISRYPASPAVRLGIFNVPVPLGARFSTVNGDNSINFVVTALADDINHAYLTAETSGTIGNDYAGAILPITTIQGLNSAEIISIIVPGDDEETDESLRKRVIETLNSRPFAGNIAAYRSYIKSIDGVGAVQVYPTWNGGGTVKCSILGSDLLPVSAALVQTVQNLVDPPPNNGLGLGYAPIGAKVTISTAAAVPVNVAAQVSLEPGYTIAQVKSVVSNAIGSYIDSIRALWDASADDSLLEYISNIYLSRIVAAIVGASGVANATNVKINGNASDLILTETSALQQVPVLGEVNLVESN